MTTDKQPSSGSSLMWLIKERLAPFNTTVLFSGTVAGVIDIVFGKAPLLLSVIACMLLIALLFLGFLPHMPAAIRPRSFGAGQNGLRVPVGKSLLLCLLAASMIFGGAARASHKHNAQGGALADLFPLIASMQHKLDLLHQDNQETARTIRTLKRESSDNPRKELANQGMSWTTSGFREAVAAHDVAAMNLYLLGGMRADADAVSSAFGSGDAALQAMFTRFAVPLDAEHCGTLRMYTKDAAVDAAQAPQIALIKAYCAVPTYLPFAAADVKRKQEAVQAVVDERKRLADWRDHPERCHAAILAHRGPRLNTMMDGDLYLAQRDGRSDMVRSILQTRCAAVGRELDASSADDASAALHAAQRWQSWIE